MDRGPNLLKLHMCWANARSRVSIGDGRDKWIINDPPCHNLILTVKPLLYTTVDLTTVYHSYSYNFIHIHIDLAQAVHSDQTFEKSFQRPAFSHHISFWNAMVCLQLCSQRCCPDSSGQNPYIGLFNAGQVMEMRSIPFSRTSRIGGPKMRTIRQQVHWSAENFAANIWVGHSRPVYFGVGFCDGLGGLWYRWFTILLLLANIPSDLVGWFWLIAPEMLSTKTQFPACWASMKSWQHRACRGWPV